VSEAPIDEPERPATSAARWDAATVLSGGHSHDIGRFQFFVADQRWVWSDAVARMHGYRPGQVNPTTELLLSHKHPDDRAKVAEILHRVQAGGLFSSRHRIIDVKGRIHWMVVVSDHLTDPSGQVIGTQGYYIDVTAGLQSDLTAAMGRVVESRAAIEQAKGILMVAYDVDGDRAFEILKWRSQATRQKLKDVAEQLVTSLRRAGLSPDSISTIDQLLLADDQPED
jgi:PAS domain S-box-containing protein